MMIKICALLIVFAAMTINAAPSDLQRITRHISQEGDNVSMQVSDREWEDYKRKFNKTYINFADETERRALYLATKISVEEHNKKYRIGKSSFKATISRLADRKPFEKRMNSFIRC